MKKLLAFILVTALCATGFARSISGGSRSFSAPRSTSSFSRPSSIGMTRPSVVAPRPSTPPAIRTSPHVAPSAPAAAPSYSAPAAASSGSPFMASLGGSLLGSMLGNAISGPRGGTTVVNSGSPGVAAGSAPVLVEGTGGSSVWSFLGDLIGVITILAILAAAVFIVLGLWRLRQSKKLADAGLPFGAIEKFMAVQKAYAGKDSEALGALLGPDMKQMLDDLPETAAVSQIRNVSYEVLDMSRGAISIWYKADDFADDSKISETWHFTQQGSGWVLNGIEQV